jgi:hypothetical protein
MADITIESASDLMSELRLAQSGDWWGDTMAWLFAVCGEMHERDLPIPAEWHYQPGIQPKDPDLYETEICEAASDQALRTFGRALHRYAAKLKEAGQDY